MKACSLVLSVLCTLANGLVGQTPLAFEWRLAIGAGWRAPIGAWELPSGAWLLAWEGTATEPPYLGTTLARVEPCGNREWRTSLTSLQDLTPPLVGQDGQFHFLGVENGQITRLSVDEFGGWKKQSVPGSAASLRALPLRDGWLALYPSSPETLTIARLSLSLEVVWQRNMANFIRWPEAEHLAALEDGGFVVLADRQLIRFSAQGEALWRKPLRITGETLPVMISVAGGVVLAGSTSSPETKFGMADLLIYKHNLDGQVAWESFLGGYENEGVKALLPAKDDGVVVLARTRSGTLRASGVSQSWPQHGFIFAAKLNSTGGVEFLESVFDEYQVQFDAFPLGAASAPSGEIWVAAGFVPSSAAAPTGGVALLDERLKTKERHIFPGCDALVDPQACNAFPSLRVIPIPSGALVSGRSLSSSDVILFRLSRSSLLTECPPLLRTAPGRTAHGAWLMLTRVGWKYRLETSPTMRPGSWTELISFRGDGTPFAFPGLVDPANRRQFFRIQTESP